MGIHAIRTNKSDVKIVYYYTYNFIPCGRINSLEILITRNIDHAPFTLEENSTKSALQTSRSFIHCYGTIRPSSGRKRTRRKVS